MRNHLRIGFIDYVLEPDKPGITGLSDIVWDMAGELVKLGQEVHIIGSYHTEKYPYPEIHVHNFPTPPIGYRNMLGHLWILKKAASIIGDLSLDLLHTPEYFSSAFFSALGIELPVVLTVPGNIYERIENGNPFDRITTQVLKVAAKISARKCTKVIATSRKMARWWKKTGVPSSRLVLIPYGVNPDIFKPVENAKNELGIPPERKVVLYAGRISAEKGVEYLISAIRILCNKFRNIELHLVGNGGDQAYFHDSLSRSGFGKEVIMHGHLPKSRLPRFYSAADVTVLPSLSEGLPRTMLEAMACASPFLGTKITGIEDHVQDQINGYLVEPGDSRLLASKIEAILKNPEQAQVVAHNGAAYIRANLAWREISRRILDEVYSDVIDY
jgi:glycosyltransferase involved in cell wall biosynthesis